MLCGDGETIAEADTLSLARRAFEKQVQLIGAAVCQVAQRLPAPPTAVVLAGSGEFLARLVLQRLANFPDLSLVTLAQQLGPELSAAACAHAVAVLAAEGRHD